MIEQLIDIVAEYYGFTREQLISRRKAKKFADARHVAMYMCRLSGYTEKRVGEAFDGRDHSSVNHAYHKIDNQMKRDYDLYSELIEIDVMLVEYVGYDDSTPELTS